MVDKSFKLSLISVAVLALTACGGGDGGNQEGGANSSTPVVKMNSVEKGYQTFKPRDHELSAQTVRAALFATGANAVDDGSSQYVYENPDNGELSSITFEGDDAEEIPPPIVESVIDLNTKYSAITLKNAAVFVDGLVYEGRYTLIQNKETGNLYPLVENGKPIFKYVDAEHEAWVTNARFSHNADIERIYMRHGDAKSLHKAVLVDGAFRIQQIFDDYDRDDVILPNGEVISLLWGAKTLVWVNTDGVSKEFTITNNVSLPFLHAGIPYIIDYTNGGKMSTLAIIDGELSINDAQWNAGNYSPTSQSVVRGDYRMNTDCSVYHFNDETKTITPIAATAELNGLLTNAGQNAFFCMYSAIDSDKALPSFMRFDIELYEQGLDPISTVDASSGTRLDAGERMVVTSDNELMFYQYPKGSFTEYYVNFESGLTTEKEVSAMTAIKMQTVKE